MTAHSSMGLGERGSAGGCPARHRPRSNAANAVPPPSRPRSPLTKILNAASPPGAPYVGTDTAMHVLLAYVAAPAILSALSLAAWGLAQGKGGSAKRKAA